MKLLNSTIMPNEGTYQIKKISPEEFGRLIAHAKNIESYIMFKSTAEVIKKLSGKEVPIRKKKCFFNGEEEEYLALTLKDGYHNKIDASSFNYYKIKYQP